MLMKEEKGNKKVFLEPTKSWAPVKQRGIKV